MREQPQADELLRYAREVLRQEIIPALPKEHRLTGFMIANAMGIATRQLQNGDEHDYMELNDLTKLMYSIAYESASLANTKVAGDPIAKTEPAPLAIVSTNTLLYDGVLSHTELQEKLTVLNRQLAQLIRNRDLNGKKDLVLQHLEHISAFRATESGG